MTAHRDYLNRYKDYLNAYKDYSVLVVDKEIDSGNLRSKVVQECVEVVKGIGCNVLQATNLKDGRLLATNPGVCCIVAAWNTVESVETSELDAIKAFNPYISIFLYTEKECLDTIPPAVFEYISGYMYLYEDTPEFIAGRIKEAVDGYITDILPPFFKELVTYTRDYKYGWHTPGHSGGMAFLKSPVGRPLFEFFGENTFRSDLSVSVPELGSLQEHTGVTGDAEKAAAGVFGADATYFVLNGTSTANKMVWSSAVSPGDKVLVDRNCHKSLMYAIIMTGAEPVYLEPVRNEYGIIGPVPRSQFEEKAKGDDIQLAVITNSTYDGLCYDVTKISVDLKDKVNIIHFDEAWFAYARFHPFYKDHYGMGLELGADSPTIFATQSTHKLLAAFSQASMLHIKKGDKWAVDHDRFNEAFMMHTSTSPQYNMIAALDVATHMMKGSAGEVIMQDTIVETLVFRTQFDQIKESEQDGWPFSLWQPGNVCRHIIEGCDSGRGKTDPKDWIRKIIGSYDREKGEVDPKDWILKPGDSWHGFKDLDDDYVLLDPTKVTILTPGIDEDDGIPASIVSWYLRILGVVVEKTGLYSFLVLFSSGVTKGKSGTLLARLRRFMTDYKANTPLKEISTGFAGPHHKEGLRDFSADMDSFLKRERAVELMDKLYLTLPRTDVIPAQAYNRLVKNDVETVAIRELEGRTSAVMVVPYPPGIPIIMPGEVFDKDIVDYLAFCEDFDSSFPGFETEIHGLIKDQGKFSICCLK